MADAVVVVTTGADGGGASTGAGASPPTIPVSAAAGAEDDEPSDLAIVSRANAADVCNIRSGSSPDTVAASAAAFGAMTPTIIIATKTTSTMENVAIRRRFILV